MNMEIDALLIRRRCLNCPAFKPESDQLKADFTNTVAAPYRQAVSILSERILKVLADAPVPPTSDAAQPLVTSLTDGVNQLVVQVNMAYSASENLRVKVDKSLESNVAQHSQAQQQLSNSEAQINQMNIQIQSSDAQIATAHQQVNQAEQSLQAAENSVREAENKVDRARNCITGGRRRKKRGFLGKIGRAIGNFGKKIVNAPCHVVNEGGINRAKDAREVAKRNRDTAVQRLQNLQNGKTALENQRTGLINSQQQLIALRDHLQNSINSLNDTKGKILALSQKLKQVLEHLGAFKVRTEVLKETVSRLIDAENLLNPIQSAADLIVSYTGDLNDANLYQTIKRTMAHNVEVLKIKLPQYPLIVPKTS